MMAKKMTQAKCLITGGHKWIRKGITGGYQEYVCDKCGKTKTEKL